jgi:hypothetical protein
MRIRVELHADDSGIAIPQRVHLDGRQIDVVETLDRWYGADYSYIKLKGSDGSVYILRLDETHAEWELTMFRSAQAQGFTA